MKYYNQLDSRTDQSPIPVRSAVKSATSHLVTRSSRHTVMSSHGELVTGQLVTRASRHSQLVTSEHITKPPVVIFLSAHRSDSTQKQCSTRTAYLRQACNIEVTDDGEALEWDER